MNEKGPTPITKGIEIQRRKIQELYRDAYRKYKDVTPLIKAVEERISVLSEENDPAHTSELAQLFHQKHDLDILVSEIDQILLRCLQEDSSALQKWLDLAEKMREVEADTKTTLGDQE
jgi:hypothetical protein